MAIDERAAEVPAPGRPRPRAALVLTIVAAVAMGLAAVALAVTHRGGSRPSSPTFSADDGLPETLDAGVAYTARLTVGVGGDWAAPDDLPGTTTHVVVGALINTEGPAEQWSILCSGTVRPGETVTLSCPFVAPTLSGTPVDIALGTGEPQWLDDQPWQPAHSRTVYHHTVD